MDPSPLYPPCGRCRAVRLSFASLLAAAALFAAGCAAVPVYRQERVSQPAMTFSNSLVDDASLKLLPQLESGSAVSGGAQAAGCTACR